VQFYVKDTGIGISKDRQEAIFERFVQSDVSDKMARQGAGLGLSISRAYVRMLNGNIWLKSEEGLGSEFFFTIPYKPSGKFAISNMDNKNNTGNEIPVKNLKILIAEDDDLSGKLLMESLKNNCREFIHVKNGIEAIQACKKNPDIDLVLMDIRMPLMDGYQATRQIRRFNKEVVIIAQTAFGLTGDLEMALKVGCNAYISKPIIHEELHRTIRGFFIK